MGSGADIRLMDTTRDPRYPSCVTDYPTLCRARMLAASLEDSHGMEIKVDFEVAVLERQ